MFDILVEFLGTFFFLSVILATGQAIPIGLALMTAIYFGGHISGGHFNPAVTTMMAIKGTIGFDKFVGYIVAQILGGIVAFIFYNTAIRSSSKSKR
jgi:aquaporin Z